MPAIVTNKYRIYAAEKFIEGLGATPPLSNNDVYVFIGKTLPWSSNDAVGATDNTPPLPADTVAGSIGVWANMMSMKKLNAADAVLVCQRFNWTLNTVYNQYDQNIDFFDPTLGLQPFYVITSDLNVYKCLFNFNNSPSFVEPTGTSTNVITTSDGYKWKYMFTVSTSDAQNFLTDQWIPVKTLLTSNNTLQWDVQQNAINGALEVINILTPGSGYASIPTVTVSGDGTGCTAIATINNGSIASLIITNPGQNYTFATATVTHGQVTLITINIPGTGYVSAPLVTITGDGSGATAHATVAGGSVTGIIIDTPGNNYTHATVNIAVGSGILATATATLSQGVTLQPVISPPGGHGSDAVAELGGFNVMMVCNLQFAENGFFTTTNDFRTFGLILNPLQWNSKNVETGTDVICAHTLNLTSVTGTFANDVEVQGSISGATGYIMDYTSGILRLVNVIGTFLAGESVATLDTINSGLLQQVSGIAQAGASNTITLASGDSAATNAYKGFTIRLTSGPGLGQQAIITANDATSKIATVSVPWAIIPDSSTHYSIANVGYPTVQPNTGYIMYVNNTRPLQRALAQTESLRPVVEF